MPPTTSWRPLPLPLSAEMPVLLVSMNVDAAAYTVHITDMANIWTESLDRKAICIRGWGENTSIDPSDTPDNMTKFLRSLQGALDSSHPGHSQTKLHLMRASQADAGDDGLALQITCELPGLQPLKWPMHLKKAPASAISTDLVLPLVQAHSMRHREVQSLISIVTQKDAVLEKLLDKLDAMGTGLEHVFNSLSGKKKVSRAAAAEKVPGLVPLNHLRWKLDAASSEEGPSNTEALVTEVFGGEGLTVETTAAIRDGPQLDQWWCEFSGISSSQGLSQRTASISGGRTPHPDEDSMDIDDDFQVQSTPPHLAPSLKPTATKSEHIPDDASTGDELESPRVVRNVRIIPTRPSEHETRKRTTQLGTVSGKKPLAISKSPSPIPSPQAARNANHNVNDSETASEADDATASVPDDDPHPSSPLPPKANTKKSGLGIGQIGGFKSKEPTQKLIDTVDTVDTQAGEASEQPPRQHAPKRLGVIGKNKASETSQVKPPADEGRGRSRGTKPKGGVVSETTERETSRERADRKREELKRELQRKSAAGPAKKKRKF